MWKALALACGVGAFFAYGLGFYVLAKGEIVAAADLGIYVSVLLAATKLCWGSADA